ncbi:hypothetical protein ACFXPN_29650 [Streptomyces griseorubiginosus]|uniref:hypothetical protein n=1 Tax=Streptomyces griseorubiginosus TaxID=67304 RepID=UPI003683C4F2
MTSPELATEALTVLWTLVRAAALWVLAALATATLTGLALAALLLWLAGAIHDNDDDPTENS